MKKYFLVISLLLIGWTFASCNKEEKPKDDIVFANISKIIIAPFTDSIPGTCTDYIFEFINNSKYSANINRSNNLVLCNALGIISKAINYTENNPIIAGQIE